MTLVRRFADLVCLRLRQTGEGGGSPPSSPDGDCTATSELADALRESVNELLTYKNDQLVGDQKLYALRASSEEVLDVVNSVEIAHASK